MRREAGLPLRDLELRWTVVELMMGINELTYPDLDLLDAFDWADFERLPEREREGVRERLLRLPLPLRLRDLDGREALEAGREPSEAICKLGELERLLREGRATSQECNSLYKTHKHTYRLLRLPEPEREREDLLPERLLRGDPALSMASLSGKGMSGIRGLCKMCIFTLIYPSLSYRTAFVLVRELMCHVSSETKQCIFWGMKHKRSNESFERTLRSISLIKHFITLIKVQHIIRSLVIPDCKRLKYGPESWRMKINSLAYCDL